MGSQNIMLSGLIHFIYVLYIVPNCLLALIKVKEELDRTMRYPLNDLHSAKQKVLSTFFFLKNLIPVLNLNRSCVLRLQSKTSSWAVSGGVSEIQGLFSSTCCDRYIRGAQVCSRVMWTYVKCLLSSRFLSTAEKRVIQQHQSHSLVHLYHSFHIVEEEHLCGIADWQKQQALKV